MRADLFYPPRNFGAIPVEYASFETSPVVILPIPYDSTTDFRPGARNGPQAIIDASQNLELFDWELGRETYRRGIHTLPEVQLALHSPEAMIDRVQEVARELLRHHKTIVMLGGEHSLAVGMGRALKEKWPRLSVLQLDAHADLRDEYTETQYSNACVARRLRELCPVVPVGVRSLSQEEHAYIQDQGLTALYPPEISLSPDSVERILSALSAEVYVTIDLDVFDPSIMAAVGHPEPGGLGWHEALELLRAVAQRKKVVAFDLVELSPGEGPVACAFLAAKLVYKLLGYISQP